MNNTEQKDVIDNKSITIMVKIVGTACNMQCKYCYEHVASNEHKGSEDFNSIKKYLSKYEDYDHVFIVFHGGEPLLAKKELMAELLEYIFLNFNRHCHVQIQTNGTLLDYEWIEIFEKYVPKLSLSISLDPKGKLDLRGSDKMEYRQVVVDNIKKFINRIENIGIISVAHAYNVDDFIPFILELQELGISSLTINKYQTKNFNSDCYISEKEYVDLLKRVFVEWISNRWYNIFNIQPLLALFSNHPNKICTYLPDENKCSYFKTFYNEYDCSDLCDHISNKDLLKVEKKCLACDVYAKCGGGCLAEKKHNSFCEARRELFDFIEEVKNGNLSTVSK